MFKWFLRPIFAPKWLTRRRLTWATCDGRTRLRRGLWRRLPVRARETVRAASLNRRPTWRVWEDREWDRWWRPTWPDQLMTNNWNIYIYKQKRNFFYWNKRVHVTKAGQKLYLCHVTRSGFSWRCWVSTGMDDSKKLFEVFADIITDIIYSELCEMFV